MQCFDFKVIVIDVIMIFNVILLWCVIVVGYGYILNVQVIEYVQIIKIVVDGMIFFQVYQIGEFLFFKSVQYF